MPGVAAPSSNPENAHAELAFNVPPGVPSPFGPPLPLPVISPANAALAPPPTTAVAHVPYSWVPLVPAPAAYASARRGRARSPLRPGERGPFYDAGPSTASGSGTAA